MDAWVGHYKEQRPHQGLDDKLPVMPADDSALLELWLPSTLVSTPRVSPVADAVTMTRGRVRSGLCLRRGRVAGGV